MLDVELFEHVCFELSVCFHRLDDLFALLVGGSLDEVGDLGRMEAGQLPIRDMQPGGRHVGDERFDARPVDEGARRYVASHPSRQQPPQRRPAARVDAHDLPDSAHLRQLDLLGADEPTAHKVDEVAGE